MSLRLLTYLLFTHVLIGVVSGGCTSVRKPAYGGQTSDSPDGKYCASVVNPEAEKGVAVLKVTLESNLNGGTKLLETTIEIPGRAPFIPLREAASVMRWAADSRSFSINLGEAKLITIDVGALE